MGILRGVNQGELTVLDFLVLFLKVNRILIVLTGVFAIALFAWMIGSWIGLFIAAVVCIVLWDKANGF